MSRLQVQETVEIAGYAAELASSLVKESIEESGREEGQWSIPCSKDCHSHRHETAGQCGGGSGQLCWTPEGTVSLDTMDTVQTREVGLCKTGEEGEDVRLRKGASVPNVSCDDEDQQDSQHCKSHKRSFLRTLGLGGKTGSDAVSRPGHKMRSLRKTLSSLFRRTAEDSGTRTAAVPPGQRALPPVPARQDSQTSQESQQVSENNLELRDDPDGGGDLDSVQEHQQADNLMDFAASIEKVKDVS